MSVGLKISFVTDEPTLKGHRRNNCVVKNVECETLEHAERFALMCSELIDELVKQIGKPKSSIIVPGGNAA